MENFQIREIDHNDGDAIRKIRALISKNDAYINLEKVVKQQTSGFNIVAMVDNQVVGYMISNLLHAGFGLAKTAWIISMGVDPDFMGQGIGKKLANKIFETYKEQNIDYIFSSVAWDSIDLLSFFKTLGFERSEFINLRKKL